MSIGFGKSFPAPRTRPRFLIAPQVKNKDSAAIAESCFFKLVFIKICRKGA